MLKAVKTGGMWVNALISGTTLHPCSKVGRGKEKLQNSELQAMETTFISFFLVC